MKRSSFRRPEQFAGRLRALLAAGFFVLVLLIALFRLLLPDTFAKVTASLFSLGEAGAQGVGDIGLNSQELAREVRELKTQNAKLQAREAVLTARLQDVEALIDFPADGYTYVAAGVIAGPPVTLYDTLLVDGGRQDGISEGALAFGPGGIPVGSVESVDRASARIKLFSSAGDTTAGWLGEERLAVVVKGAGAGAYEISVPKEVEVVVGDAVFLPGPGALPIGVVARVIEHASSPEKLLQVHPAVNIFSLTYVSVRKGTAP